MQGMVDEEEERWIKYYSSRQKILLVGEGDFSFSVCLARAFASASNMIATSLDTREMVIAKYSKGAANLKELKELGCSIMYKLDVHTMSQNPSLKKIKFDRIVYNFPHAGFHYPGEHCPDQIKNAREMLSKNGEAHVTHKISHPFIEWRIEELAEECGLYLVEEVGFSKFDYPGCLVMKTRKEMARKVIGLSLLEAATHSNSPYYRYLGMIQFNVSLGISIHRNAMKQCQIPVSPCYTQVRHVEV